MHIILSVLGAIITVLILLNRLSDAGIDIGWLDPFKWTRRRKWIQRVNTNPVFLIKDPMESTAGLMYAIIKCSGDITLEEKKFLLSIFKNDFFLSEKEAADLLSTCSYYIKDVNLVKNDLKKYLDPSLTNFSTSQINSALDLIGQAAGCCSEPNETQLELLNNIRRIMKPEPKNNKWR